MHLERELTLPRIQSPPRARLEICLLALVLTAALALRCYKLDRPLMWNDEAESAINALTILERGYPGDRYLGLPIFENILIERWPEHPEYEFRDSSYSKDGLAVYHSWLPLYAMGASLRAFGIEPSADPSRLTPKYDVTEMSRRTIAARVPSVLFGMAFLVLVYALGRELYGRDAGWTALLAAAVAVPVVGIAREARYFSLTVALCTACCLMIWRIAQRGLWRDWILGAVCAVLMFHTHTLTFGIVCAAGLAMLPRMLRSERAVLKIMTAAAIAIAGILPWMLATGFLTAATKLPKAIATLELPWDLFIYPLDRWPVTLFLLASVAWLALAHARRHSLPQYITAPFLGARGAFAFLIAWGLIGWLAFMLLIPAASLFFQRAYLGVLGPGIVLGAMIFAAVGRVIGKRYSIPIGCALYLGFIYANARAEYSWRRDTLKSERIVHTIEHMRQMQLHPGTKLYAVPGDQLILTYYTDVPVQSIAPVRKEFLDSYAGDVVIFECFVRFVPLWPQVVRDVAGRHGVKLTEPEAESWARRLTMRGMGDYLHPRVARVMLPDEPLPEFARELIAFQREHTLRQTNGEGHPVKVNPAVFRGFQMTDYSGWWQTFFYRFANPHARGGENVNYARRIRNATATVLPGTFVVYHSPGSNQEQRLVQSPR